MSKTGWRSRGYLPHCDERGLVQHVIFGLADALPKSAPSAITDAAARAAWADLEFDRQHGSRLLAKPHCAALVEDCLLFGDCERYALVAWCVMPTHVHVLIEQWECASLADVVHGWKSVSAHAINRAECRNGVLWRREYFDRFMRTEEQYAWTVAYIERNPVTAKLIGAMGDWPYSSARWRKAG